MYTNTSTALFVQIRPFKKKTANGLHVEMPRAKVATELLEEMMGFYGFPEQN